MVILKYVRTDNHVTQMYVHASNVIKVCPELISVQ